MKHTNFKIFRNRITGSSSLVYVDDSESIEEQVEDIMGYSPNDYDLIENYKDASPNELVEILSSMMEDANWHSRCQYEPELLMDSMIHAGIDAASAKKAFLNMIEGFEKVMEGDDA